MSKTTPDPRKRAARNFRYYTRRLIHRVGMRDGLVGVKIRQGNLNPVQVAVFGHSDLGGKSAARRSYTFPRLQGALQTRLERLLRNCTLQFGEIEIRVHAGEIADIRFIFLVRPDELEELAHVLFNARKKVPA